MARSRFDPDAPSARTERVGEVYAALVADDVQRESLGTIYRKLFEARGLRHSATAAHVIYVQPSRARCEIRDVAAWLHERFGAPGAGVPSQTPFGYLGGSRWDGWITYFAALAHGSDFDLQRDFTATIANLRWADKGGASRTQHAPPEAQESPPPTTQPQRSPQAAADVARARETLAEQEPHERERERRDVEEELRRRQEKQDSAIEELRMHNEWLKREIEAEKARAGHEVHPSVRAGKTGEKQAAQAELAAQRAADETRAGAAPSEQAPTTATLIMPTLM